MKHKTSLCLDRELMRALRVKAAMTGINMTTAFEDAIRRYVTDTPSHFKKAVGQVDKQ